MIRLQRSLIEGLKTPTPQTVADALQSAIELEHATIPVYLYGLYSLDPARNAAVAGIVQSVVVEEMLHMTLAANVMNAIGGNPDIDGPGFIPTYPGPLPGGVEGGLTVHLAPFSSDQLLTYLQIEQPQNVIDIPILNPLLGPIGQPDGNDGITIGEFYEAILAALAQLPASAFRNPARNQVGPDLMPEAVVVTDLASAQQALNTIIEQGEGNSTSPLEVVGDGYAHYYRFLQVFAGATLLPAPGKTPPWKFGAPSVLLDVEGVHPLPTDPKAVNYPAGSAQAFANDTFNYTYTGLLKSLHALFNGANTQDQMNVAIGLMMSLKGQARAMMAGIPDPSGPYTGPSFEYQPTNPAAA
jgi:hypothetical protein